MSATLRPGMRSSGRRAGSRRAASDAGGVPPRLVGVRAPVTVVDAVEHDHGRPQMGDLAPQVDEQARRDIVLAVTLTRQPFARSRAARARG